MADCELNVKEHLWHVIINPNACEQKCFNFWDKISSILDQNEVRYMLHKSEGAAKGIEIVKELCMNNVCHLIVIGGDGTINEVVNGIMQSKVDPRNVYLAVIPLGRGNDWARTHQYPQDIKDSVDVFLNGCFMKHDVGLVQTIRNENVVGERYFANIAGFGFDAEVIYDTVSNKPHFAGVSTYLLSLARCLFRYKSVPVQVYGPNFKADNKVFTMAVAICQYNGGGMRQAPMACPNDGLLDVVVVKKLSKLRIMTLVKSLFDGSHIQKVPNKVLTYQSDKVSISSPKMLRAEVEGELLETGKYEVSIIPQTLNMLTNRG